MLQKIQLTCSPILDPSSTAFLGSKTVKRTFLVKGDSRGLIQDLINGFRCNWRILAKITT